jgi:cysteine-rich repeat protein
MYDFRSSAVARAGAVRTDTSLWKYYRRVQDRHLDRVSMSCLYKCLASICAAIMLTACSVEAVTFTPGDDQVAEDCTVAGDEDGNGLADCSDPACAGAMSCQLLCGNGRVDAGETCDDGNKTNIDGCNNRCTVGVLEYVKASNTGNNDNFGYSVALSADGSTMAVGAVAESSAAVGIGGNQTDNSATNAGAVYVFVRSGATWIQQSYVKASNTGASDLFGWSVALSADGSTLAVSAIQEASTATGVNGDQADNSATEAGAVYVFTRSGTTWSQQSYVKASNTAALDRFGWSVALSGDGATLAVSAFQEDSAATGVNGNDSDNTAPNAGAVYMFTRIGTTWVQQAYVKASNTGAGDFFGWSIALSGDGSTLAVGAYQEASAATGVGGDQTTNSTTFAGAVYVFTRSGTTWSQQAYVKASNTRAGAFFGSSVALSADGSTLAVGATGETSAATGVGGDQTDNSAMRAGAVYMLERGGTTWTQRAYIKASNTGSEDFFGSSVALSGDGSILAVSAFHETSAATGIDSNQSDNSANIAGAVYVLANNGATLSQQAYVKASNTNAGDLFGHGLALSTDGLTLAASAVSEDSKATGIGGDQTDNSAFDAGAVYVLR